MKTHGREYEVREKIQDTKHDEEDRLTRPTIRIITIPVEKDDACWLRVAYVRSIDALR